MNAQELGLPHFPKIRRNMTNAKRMRLRAEWDAVNRAIQALPNPSKKIRQRPVPWALLTAEEKTAKASTMNKTSRVREQPLTEEALKDVPLPFEVKPGDKIEFPRIRSFVKLTDKERVEKQKYWDQLNKAAIAAALPGQKPKTRVYPWGILSPQERSAKAMRKWEKKSQKKVKNQAIHEKKALKALNYRPSMAVQDCFVSTVQTTLQQLNQDSQAILPKTPNGQTYQKAFRDFLSAGLGMEKKRPSHTKIKKKNSRSSLLYDDFIQMTSNSSYKLNERARQELPVYRMRQEILFLINNNQVSVICGENGSKKNIQVPQFILDDYLWKRRGAECYIVCVQPHRISAVAAAEQVAKERCEKIGNSVGFHALSHREMPRSRGSILYCTKEVFFQKLKHDRYLDNISHLVLDEVHTRDMDMDFLLILLRDMLQVRHDLKLILLSGTPNSQLFSQYFATKAPPLVIPSTAFHVKKFMLEDVIDTVGYAPSLEKTPKIKLDKEARRLKEEFLNYVSRNYSPPTKHILQNWSDRFVPLTLLANLIEHLTEHYPAGKAILVFVPDLTSLIFYSEKLKFISRRWHQKIKVVCLHTLLNPAEQTEVFDPPSSGTWKVIFATSIAENGLPLIDVRFVINFGKILMSYADEKNANVQIQSCWISQERAKQRENCAGRSNQGMCFNLYTSFQESFLQPFTMPEIMRTSLESLILRIKILNLGKTEDFLKKAIDVPPWPLIQKSFEFTKLMYAIDSIHDLTPLGFLLARLPYEPQIGKLLLLGTLFSCLSPLLTVAATLIYTHPFLVHEKKSDVRFIKKKFADSLSDHAASIRAFDDWKKENASGNGATFCQRNHLIQSSLEKLEEIRQEMAQQLSMLHLIDSTKILDPLYNRNSENMDLVRALICGGLYPNLAKIRAILAMKDKENKDAPVTIKMGKGIHEGFIDLSSVNTSLFYKDTKLPSPWLVYSKMVQTCPEEYTPLFLFETTFVNPPELLFFGGIIEYRMKSQTVHLNDWVVFNCPKEKFDLIMSLRQSFDELLAYKVFHPGPTQWDTEGKLLQPIIELFSTSSQQVPTSSGEPQEEFVLEDEINEDSDMGDEEEEEEEEYLEVDDAQGDD